MKKKSLLAYLVLFVFVTTACNFPNVSAPATVDDSPIHTLVAETLVAQLTQDALEQSNLSAAESQTPLPDDQDQPPAATLPPTDTATLPPPTNTPTITPTPTSSAPMIIVSVNTNCRTGPGKIYDMLGALLVGETAKVLGKADSGDYWVIENHDAAGNCWLWGEYATVTGDTSTLPVLTPPPSPTPSSTPTPALDFTVAYENSHSCGAIEYMTFYVKNTGPTTLESVKVVIVELSSSTTLFDGFTDVPFVATALGCPPDLNNIGPGAAAFIAVSIGASPPPPPNPGDHEATITICSQDGLTGFCLTKVVVFTIPSP